MASHRIYRRVNPRLFPGDKIKAIGFAIQKAVRERSEGVRPHSMCSMEDEGKGKAAANAEAKGGGRKAGAAAARPKAAPPQAGREARRATAAFGQASRGRAARRQCASRGSTERARQRRQATALQGFRCRPHSAAAPLRFASLGRLLRRVGTPALPRAGLPSLAGSLRAAMPLLAHSLRAALYLPLLAQ